mmetsp:Transcript_133525/g.285536  ORF Transcript_133525/g.285536 Transcript_133525/m.285536 type:complete len:213 (-) Transcript_133525:94-732(-)
MHCRRAREPEVGDLRIGLLRRRPDRLHEEHIATLQISVQDLRPLSMQVLHARGHVRQYLDLLSKGECLPRVVQKVEEATTGTELGNDEEGWIECRIETLYQIGVIGHARQCLPVPVRSVQCGLEPLHSDRDRALASGEDPCPLGLIYISLGTFTNKALQVDLAWLHREECRSGEKVAALAQVGPLAPLCWKLGDIIFKNSRQMSFPVFRHAA